MARRMSRGSLQPRSASCSATWPIAVFEVEGVGEVELGVEVDGAVVGDLVGVEVEVPGVGGVAAVLVGGVGVVAGAGFLDGAVELGVGELVGDGGEVAVHEPGAVHGQGVGGLGDPAGLPHRYRAGDDLCPEAGESVAGLDGVAEVLVPGVGGGVDGECELGDAELRDEGGTGSGDGELALGAGDGGGVVEGGGGVQVGPVDGEGELADLEVVDAVMGRGDGSEQPGRGGRVVEVLGGGCHGSIQALGTDSPMPQNPPVHRVLRVAVGSRYARWRSLLDQRFSLVE